MKKLKVGFDLDGVLLYNPARIARMPISIFKRLFLKKKRLVFYFPRSRLHKFIWRLFHLSSIFIAPGFEDIKELTNKGKIEAYIITARYNFLENDLKYWVDKMKINHIFTGIYQNLDNEQPHLFKERMIKKLDLDIFVEDNFDIVKHLSKNTKTKIVWIFNLLDRKIKYPYKYPSLKKTVDNLSGN